MQNGLLSWLLIKACIQQEMSLAYLVFGPEMLFTTALLRGERSHVTERSSKGPAWNQIEDTTNMLFKCTTAACCFIFYSVIFMWG